MQSFDTRSRMSGIRVTKLHLFRPVTLRPLRCFLQARKMEQRALREQKRNLELTREFMDVSSSTFCTPLSAYVTSSGGGREGGSLPRASLLPVAPPAHMCPSLWPVQQASQEPWKPETEQYPMGDLRNSEEFTAALTHHRSQRQHQHHQDRGPGSSVEGLLSSLATDTEKFTDDFKNWTPLKVLHAQCGGA